MGMRTPWGESQSVETVVPGIVFVSTASHGGYRVSKKLLDTMPEHLRSKDGWYEEDCEACKVVLAFPWAFDADKIVRALTSYNHWFKKEKQHA